MSDDWKNSVWYDILPYLPPAEKGNKIWYSHESTKCDRQIFQELGYKLFPRDPDFYSSLKWRKADLVLSYPPESELVTVLVHLKCDQDKPFIVCMDRYKRYEKNISIIFKNDPKLTVVQPFKRNKKTFSLSSLHSPYVYFFYNCEVNC